MIKKLEKVIIFLSSMHKILSKEIDLYINLKRTTVSSKYDLDKELLSTEFINYIRAYIDEITIMLYAEKNTVLFLRENRLRNRVKQEDSIISKLEYYLNKNEGGNVPINKCLNDLIGFRMILSLWEFEDDILQLLNMLKQNLGIVYYKREDNDYKAIHVYFKSNNNCYFPWELQLWDINDYKKNELSHKNHKQKRVYARFSNEYDERGV